jgi:CheY-like chemotaxis protein
MKILVAEDSPHQREVLRLLLEDWGFEVEAVEDGDRAWTALKRSDSPHLAILDSVMPGLSGPEICRRLRAARDGRPRHVLLLTSRTSPADIEQGLDAGADDYVGKPFRESELRARLRAGQRAVELQVQLAVRVVELETALDRIRQLEGILPICSYCRKIRDGQADWQPLEKFLSARSRARFSHDICPSCYSSVVEPELDAFRTSLRDGSGPPPA